MIDSHEIDLSKTRFALKDVGFPDEMADCVLEQVLKDIEVELRERDSKSDQRRMVGGL